MRVVLQRSKEASVTVDGEIVGQIPFGLTLLVGITHEDTEKRCNLHCRKKIANLRIFEDESG
ncbi:D-tyrosyl-tRNA(Tyr) deacylase, partial [Bacillus cereus]